MKIKVRQKHINNGEAGEEETCPVALAIKEQTKLKYIYVNKDTIRWAKSAKYEDSIVDTPIRVKNFIDKFDSGALHDLEPFEFNFKYEI